MGALAQCLRGLTERERRGDFLGQSSLMLETLPTEDGSLTARPETAGHKTESPISFYDSQEFQGASEKMTSGASGRIPAFGPRSSASFASLSG